MKQNKKSVLAPVLVMIVLLLILLTLLAVAFWKPIAQKVYPLAYEDSIRKYADEYGVPEMLVCAVIFQESGFRADAVSSTGDYGLMQMQETTFAEMRNRLGLPADENDILNPEQNIQCGVYYLSYLYDIYEDWEATMAAYNAGMGNVKEWLRDPEYSSEGDHLDVIPFASTKSYVERIFRFKSVYEKIYNE